MTLHPDALQPGTAAASTSTRVRSDPGWERDIAVAWASIPVAVLAVYLSTRFVAGWIPHENPTDGAALFIKELLSLWHPERLEHIRYVLAIVSAPIAFLAAFICFRRVSLGMAFRLALAGQAVVVLGWLYARRSETFAFFTPGMMLFGDALSAAICIFVTSCGGGWAQKLRRTFSWTGQTAPAVFALLLTAALLTPAIVRDREAYLSSIVLWEHMEFTAAEYFAVASGKTPMVNFFPQYNNVLPVLLAPVLKLTGCSYGAFTTVMAGLSLVGLMAAYWTLSMLTRNTLTALALYLPVLGLSFSFGGPAAWALGIFNYFAVWPIRYVGPMVVLATLMWALRSPARWRLIVVGVVAGGSLINNLDFGGPALAGAAAAIFLARPARVVRALLCFAVGALTAASMLQIGFFIRGRAWPDFVQAATYPKIFGLYGFGMIPLPSAGLYWTFCAAYMACLFVAIVSWWRGETNSIYAAVLAFVAIFGCGSFMYYVGRSHPHVLGALFFTWALAVTLLVYGVQRQFSVSSASTAWQLAVIPGVLLLTHWSLFAVLLWPNAKPIVAQLERLQLNDVQGAQQRAELSAFIRRNAGSARTILMLPTGHRIAFEERLRNEFPFPHPGTVILKAQAQQVEKVVVAKNIKKFFVSQQFEREEQQRMFERLGFQMKESFGGVNFWTRKTPAAPAQ